MFLRRISLLPLNNYFSPSLHIFTLLLCCFLLQTAYSQSVLPPTTDVTNLELNKSVEREISGTQKHIYQIPMSANQYAKVEIERLGADVAVRRIDKDGKTMVQYSLDPGSKGVVIVELTSKTTQNCLFSVEPRQKSLPPGHYRINFTELRPATETEITVSNAAELLTQANQLWRAGKIDEALPLAEQALALLEKTLGENDDQTSQALLTAANIYSDKGDLNKAESLYLRALAIKEKVLEKDDISLSMVLNNLGVLYKDKGNYVKAEACYQRALEIREKKLDPNHLLIASVLNNLATLYKLKGDIDKAELFYRRTLEIREKALGPDHPDVATTLNNIANLYSDVAKAAPIYARVLAIREKSFGPDHPDVAQTLYNMAVLYSNAGDFTKAEPLGERAVSIFEKTLGADHPLTSYPINLLAAINKKTGNYAKSEVLYQRAIAVKEKTQGPYHPDLAGVYANLANLYVVKNEIDKAIAAQTKANNIFEYNLSLNLTGGSEREKLYYLHTFSLNEKQTLSLNFQTAPDSALATDLAVTTVLQRKGRVLDAMSDSLGILRRRFNQQDQRLLDNLNDTTTKLVGLIMNGPNGLSPEEYLSNTKTLEAEKQRIEAQISQHSAGFYEQTKSITLKSVQDAIPANAALIEFAVYNPISPQKFEFASERASEDELTGVPHYAVFVVNSQGAVKSKDLGQAKDIDQAITAYRQALRDPKRIDIQKVSRTVDEKLMQPIRGLLGDSTHLLISPDGELNLIPFEALVDDKGHYLIEKYSITYLTSGRDLLRMQTSRESKSKFLIVANPSFGEPAAEQKTDRNSVKTNTSNAKRQSIIATRSLSDTYFAPLSGTAQEARLIQEVFPDARSLTENQATESALKQVIAPEILHIATHGFFLQNSQINDKNNLRTAIQNGVENTEIENPLLRSGLALAGANRHINSGDDGILTALEASGLNLWGTKLVVLSACDTGLGEVQNGEGVYGLRRAFVLAGTESLVMSLWSVSDYVTRELMVNYYKNLKQGIGRGEALRQVQLEMLKKPGRSHPFYWASFIQSGEWANLAGKR